MTSDGILSHSTKVNYRGVGIVVGCDRVMCKMMSVDRTGSSDCCSRCNEHSQRSVVPYFLVLKHLAFGVKFVFDSD